MAILGEINSPDPGLLEREEFRRAFEYLKKCITPGSPENLHLLEFDEGEVHRVELGEHLFAMEQCYLTQDRGGKRFESHENYIDIQAVIKGEESIEVAPVNGLDIDVEYDDEHDIIWYKGGDGDLLTVSSGKFAVLYPSDGHKPGLMGGSPARVYKTVVKVPNTTT
jgi:YhcH/YjgK/YiaL family protein